MKAVLQKQDQEYCIEFPLRKDFTCQFVLPKNMTSQEAMRIAAFIMSLAQPA
jgi:hypothetical protein